MLIPRAFQHAFVALLPRLRGGNDPAYAEIARPVATLGLIASPYMRKVAAEALRGLGWSPSPTAVWRFAWQWWYQRIIDELIGYQGARISPDWAARHMRRPDRLPPESCILLSIHQFNLPVAAAYAAQLLPDLGVVSMIDPNPNPPTADARKDSILIPGEERARELSVFYTRVFDGRTFPPNVAARQGLSLLEGGGSLIVLADFYGKHLGGILGRHIPVADGAVWLARRSGRPLVPFVLLPLRGQAAEWQLWCGDPITPTRAAVVHVLESAIRLAPTTWMSWRGWYNSNPVRPAAAYGASQPGYPRSASAA